MPFTYDQDGNMLGDASAPGYVPAGTFGGDLFELFHPGTVQAEDIAIGQTPPTTAEIVSGAASDAASQAAAGITAATADLAKWVFLGALVWLVAEAAIHTKG